MTLPASPTTTTSAKSERRAPVLATLKELLADGHKDAVIALVTKLLARNSELERKLADMLSRGRKNEGVSAAQLLLLLDGLAAAPAKDLDAANRQLREASGVDEKKSEVAETEAPSKGSRKGESIEFASKSTREDRQDLANMIFETGGLVEVRPVTKM